MAHLFSSWYSASLDGPLGDPDVLVAEADDEDIRVVELSQGPRPDLVEALLGPSKNLRIFVRFLNAEHLGEVFTRGDFFAKHGLSDLPSQLVVVGDDDPSGGRRSSVSCSVIAV